MVDLQLRPNSPIQLELMLTSTATKKILIHLQTLLPFRVMPVTPSTGYHTALC